MDAVDAGEDPEAPPEMEASIDQQQEDETSPTPDAMFEESPVRERSQRVYRKLGGVGVNPKTMKKYMNHYRKYCVCFLAVSLFLRMVPDI